MRNRVGFVALGVGLLLAGVAIDRCLPPRPGAAAAPSAPAASPSRFLASFDGLDTAMRHLKGVESARISQLHSRGLRVERGVHTVSYHCYCSHAKPLDCDEVKAAMRAIGDDLAAQVAAEGGTTVCQALGWHVEPGEWVYEIGGRRGVVTVLVLPLNQPTPTDLQANLVVLVQVAEFGDAEPGAVAGGGG